MKIEGVYSSLGDKWPKSKPIQPRIFLNLVLFARLDSLLCSLPSTTQPNGNDKVRRWHNFSMMICICSYL